MSLATSAKVIAAGAVWRLTGAERAGSTLIEAASSDDENAQVLAGMLLVRAGDRSVGPVHEALAGGNTALQLVDVLTSIGSEHARRGLQSLTAHNDAVGEAAQEALRTLEQIQRKPDEGSAPGRL